MLDQKLFLMLLGLNALILILDSLMWTLDGTQGSSSRISLLIITAVYYSMNPIICMLWSLYADFLINRNLGHTKKLFAFMLFPISLIVFLSFLSILTGSMFYLDESNVYHRGSLFLLMAGISYAILAYTMIVIIFKHKKIEKKSFIPILVFAFPPFVGGIIQVLFYGYSLIWICMTISVLIIFMNIQNHRLNTDYLTGVFNRRQLDRYLLQQSPDNLEKIHFSGMMIDLNTFKKINDEFGHDVGDEALRMTAELLKKTFRKRDFIARYGGDEFIILMAAENEDALPKAVERLRTNIEEFNGANTVPYTISLSIGYDYYRKDLTLPDFMKHLDDLMYQDKQSREI